MNNVRPYKYLSITLLFLGFSLSIASAKAEEKKWKKVISEKHNKMLLEDDSSDAEDTDNDFAEDDQTQPDSVQGNSQADAQDDRDSIRDNTRTDDQYDRNSDRDNTRSDDQDDRDSDRDNTRSGDQDDRDVNQDHRRNSKNSEEDDLFESSSREQRSSRRRGQISDIDSNSNDSYDDEDEESYEDGLKSLISSSRKNQVSRCELPNFAKQSKSRKSRRRKSRRRNLKSQSSSKIEDSFIKFQGDLPGVNSISFAQDDVNSLIPLEKYQVYRDCLDSQFLSGLFQRKSEFLTKKLELKKDEYTINILHTSIKKSEEQIVTYRGQQNNSAELRKNLQKQLDDLQDQKESQLSTNLYGPFIIFGYARCNNYQDHLYNDLENRLEQNLPAPELIFANKSQSKNVKKYFLYPVGARVEDAYPSNGNVDYFIFRPAILRPDMSKGEAKETTDAPNKKSSLKQCSTVCNFSIDYDKFLTKYNGQNLKILIKNKLKACRIKRAEKRAFMSSVDRFLEEKRTDIRHSRKLLDGLIQNFLASKSSRKDSYKSRIEEDNDILNGYIFKTSLAQNFQVYEDLLGMKISRIDEQINEYIDKVTGLQKEVRREKKQVKQQCEEYKKHSDRIGGYLKKFESELSKLTKLVIIKDRRISLNKRTLKDDLEEMITDAQVQAQSFLKHATSEEHYRRGAEGGDSTMQMAMIKRSAKKAKLTGFKVIQTKKNTRKKNTVVDIAYTFDIAVDTNKLIDSEQVVKTVDVGRRSSKKTENMHVTIFDEEGVAILKKANYSFYNAEKVRKSLNTAQNKWRFIGADEKDTFRSICSAPEYKSHPSCVCSWTNQVATQYDDGVSLPFPGHQTFGIDDSVQSAGSSRLSSSDIEAKIDGICGTVEEKRQECGDDLLCSETEVPLVQRCRDKQRLIIQSENKLAPTANYDIAFREPMVDGQMCGAIFIKEDLRGTRTKKKQYDDTAIAQICKEYE